MSLSHCSSWFKCLSRQQKGSQKAPRQTLKSVCHPTRGLLTTWQSPQKPTYKSDGSSWLLIKLGHRRGRCSSKVQVFGCENGDSYRHVKTAHLNQTNPTPTYLRHSCLLLSPITRIPLCYKCHLEKPTRQENHTVTVLPSVIHTDVYHYLVRKFSWLYLKTLRQNLTSLSLSLSLHPSIHPSLPSLYHAMKRNTHYNVHLHVFRTIVRKKQIGNNCYWTLVIS